MTNTATAAPALVATAPHMHHLPVLSSTGELVALACQPERPLPRRARLVSAEDRGLTCLRCSGGVMRFR